jgi:hypothetical protein
MTRDLEHIGAPTLLCGAMIFLAAVVFGFFR